MNINPFDILKNAQKLQEQMGTFQEKLAYINATGSAGGGMVEIDLNGKIEITAVRIAPEALESGDAEMLEDLVMAAFSSGLKRIKENINNEVGTMAGSLNIAGLNFPGAGFPGIS